MKHEYHEGPKAGENFVKLATVVFQAKNTIVRPVSAPKKKPTNRKASGKKQG
ncbi:MAG: hypothetical protein ACYCPD_03725 [Acidobacteriaceae bacterium]